MPVHGTPSDLPDKLEELLQSITELNGRRAGAFDVLAWQDSSIAFLESKGPGDSITDKQRSWFTAAVDAGVPADAFSIIEWSYVDPAKATKGELKGRRKDKNTMGSPRQTKGTKAEGSRAGAGPTATPTGESDVLPPAASPREIALADRLPPAVVGSIIRAGYTLCTAQALDCNGAKYTSRIKARGFLKPGGGLNAQGRAARDEVRSLGFKLTS